MVSVIIPTIKGREELLHRLLVSLPKNVEVIVVPDENLSLAQKRNIGALQSTGSQLLFIDDDNYIQKDSIEKLAEYNSAIKGMMALYDNDIFKIADGGSKRHYLSGFQRGINTNKLIDDIQDEAYEVDEVANAFMVDRDVFFNLGGFDEINFPTELDEADLCYRAKKSGYKIMMCPQAICHHKSVTYSVIPNFRRPKNAYYMARNRILFQKKHNLSLAFVSVFVLLYCVCLLRNPRMIYHFLKGVHDGLSGRSTNSY